jgi:hypothetical protein
MTDDDKKEKVLSAPRAALRRYTNPKVIFYAVTKTNLCPTTTTMKTMSNRAQTQNTNKRCWITK